MKSDSLSKGRTYFIVMFADPNLRIPVVQTLIYKEPGMRSDGSRYFLFTQVGEDRDPDFFVNEQDVDHLLLDEDGLLSKLRDCFAGKLA